MNQSFFDWDMCKSQRTEIQMSLKTAEWKIFGLNHKYDFIRVVHFTIF